MRLWSIHPKYLDRFGLLAVWREGLLAQKVLAGQTRGYKNHSQLIRFKWDRSLYLISKYLWNIWVEGQKRKYNFIWQKIWYRQDKLSSVDDILIVTKGQLQYEIEHLQRKLKVRDIEQFTANLYSIYNTDMNIIKIEPNPLFKVVEGNIENWERVK
jgi:hypothetical protein